ncbi:hypothetical protein chiPu_0024964 [Chiloscyllium punctatum]|uniref:Uncharacterized protein n=1 Tax=Chiloscyllium punctatum TaxID=137246 RepID=A0A401TDK6_CHIPU|nr:hypothetical protein [Chiloscyllium punctatum]
MERHTQALLPDGVHHIAEARREIAVVLLVTVKGSPDELRRIGTPVNHCTVPEKSRSRETGQRPVGQRRQAEAQRRE